VGQAPVLCSPEVDELLIVDPAEQTVRWFARSDERYEPVARSGLIELSPAELAGQLDWPAVEPSA
jgi:hypothetical protein